MARAKRGFKARRRRNRIRQAAKGYRGGRSKLWKAMVDTVHHAWRYATWHRRKRKRDHQEDERAPAAGLVAARRRVRRLLRRGRGRVALGFWIDEHRVSSSLMCCKNARARTAEFGARQCCKMGIASVDAQAAGDRLRRPAVRGPETAAAATQR